MIRVGLVGLGKMGISHMSIVKAHPSVDLVAVCDPIDYVTAVIEKYSRVRPYSNYRSMLAEEKLDAVFVATPSKMHAEMVRAALDADLHVFCEKPFCLDIAEGMRLAELAERKKRVNQVGYHYRFVGVFHEMKRLVEKGVLGELQHVRAEAYGPVVLRPKGSTWRTSRAEGGGCLYDYASHAIDLLNYLVGRPQSVGGTILNRLFSRDVEDEVYTNLAYASGMTGQIAANWSDESHRKMSMKVAIWGEKGKLVADRQELHIYLRDGADVPADLVPGWNVRYTTDLTEPVWFYLRGEEYSAQVDHFVQTIDSGGTETRSSFRSAVDADIVAAAMVQDAGAPRTAIAGDSTAGSASRKGGLRELFGFSRGSSSVVGSQ